MLHKVGTLAGCCLLAAWSQFALAEEAADEEGATMEEVVVTAQRREENVLDVPLAVSAFDATAIETLGISTLQDLESLIPSTTFGFDNPVTIRGVGQQAWRDASAEVGVAIYQNGLFYNETYGLLESSMFDLERVEVLRGPQGTLYGRNSMGGAINLISKKPEREFGGELLAELTAFNGRRINGAVTGPLSETLSYRLTVGWTVRDGTAENVGSAPDAGRLDNNFISPQIRLQTEKLDVNLRFARYMADEGHVDQIFFAQFPTDTPFFVGPAGSEGEQNTHYLYATPAPSATLFGAARHRDSVGEIKRKAVDHNRRNDRTIERDIVNVDARLAFSDAWSVRYIGGWSDSFTEYKHDSDFTSRVPSADNPFLSADAGVPFRDGQAILAFPKEITSNELHLLGELGAATILLGAYRFTEQSPFRLNTFEFANEFLVTFFNECPGTAPVSRDCARSFSWTIDAEVDSTAVFANAEYRFGERLTISGGLRQSEDDKSQSRNGFRTGSGFAWEEPAAARTYDDWMGHLTVELRTPSDQLLHGRYARAFRAGGFNSFTFGESERTYGGETMDSWELGYKGSYNDRMMVAFNAYLYDYSDYQQPLSYRTIIEGNPEPVDITNWINIDGSRIFGMEFETEFLLSERVRVRGFYAYTDSALGELLAFNSSNPAQLWAQGEEGDYPVNPVNLSGNPFPSLAKHQYSGSLIWTAGDFETVAIYSWVGDREGSIWNIPLDEMPAYNRWDLRVQWEPAGRSYGATVFIDNVLDTYGITENEARGWEEDFLREGQLTDGRIWGVEARYRF